ncbi:hypothetical protein GP486_002061 [Trichoglossum hirsutum]|uniref:SH3 domain-containing protein n=1 Tax=Trichoglossum hirsutum TaxID=265104 RepID=A0A9P8LEZ1_9PEZI|nr:hypothetical protein GP486_002061 [Trichoglossum hirsutum]
MAYLRDSSIITPQELSNILSLLPKETPLHAPASNGVSVVPPALSPTPVKQLEDTSLNEKQKNSHTPVPLPVAQPPPTYTSAVSSPPPLAAASALYAFNPIDSGDLAMLPNDRISVLEYTNNEWWKGRNERTGLEGVFPCSYVSVVEEKITSAKAKSYGNLPLEVSQGGRSSGQEDGKPSKLGETGKKFGKKMGDAAIFGAVGALWHTVGQLRYANMGQGRYYRIEHRQGYFLDTSFTALSVSFTAFVSVCYVGDSAQIRLSTGVGKPGDVLFRFSAIARYIRIESRFPFSGPCNTLYQLQVKYR